MSRSYRGMKSASRTLCFKSRFAPLCSPTDQPTPSLAGRPPLAKPTPPLVRVLPLLRRLVTRSPRSRLRTPRWPQPRRHIHVCRLLPSAFLDRGERRDNARADGPDVLGSSVDRFGTLSGCPSFSSFFSWFLFILQEATKRIVAHKSQNCRIVFHSAYIGYITLIGYAAYAPGRMAIRGSCVNIFSLQLALTRDKQQNSPSRLPPRRAPALQYPRSYRFPRDDVHARI